MEDADRHHGAVLELVESDGEVTQRVLLANELLRQANDAVEHQ
jgi:hypothetical protein